MALTKYEQETIINYNQEGKEATCFTYDSSLIRKLDSLCEKHEGIVKTRGGRGWGEYVFPKSWIKIHAPRKLSEEQRAKMASRMEALRKEQS